MKQRKRLSCLLLWLGACNSSPTTLPTLSAVPATSSNVGASLQPPKEELNPKFVDELEAIAKKYNKQSPAGLYLMKGPPDCRDPYMAREEAEAFAKKIEETRSAFTSDGALRKSQSNDTGSHGQKFYYLFASPLDSYQRGLKGEELSSLSLVKESWKAEEQPTGITRPTSIQGKLDPYFQEGERLYKVTEVSGLFVMYKLPPETPETDKGWVYGTLRKTQDGFIVTSAGRVSSCMKCHQKTETRLLSALP
jgi:hypothetical protein